MRKYYIDNVRYFTIVTVVLFHVIYMFNGSAPEGVIGPFHKNQTQDIFQYIVYPWIMVLLFIISGISSNLYLKKYSNFIRDRTIKLLVPSTIGLFVFQWIQGYYNMLLSDAFNKIKIDNKIILYIIMCLAGTGVLWFNQVLWVNSIILFLIKKIEKNKLLNFLNDINCVFILFFGLGLWLSAQILNTPIIICYRWGIFLYSFLIGYFIFSSEDNIKKLVNIWHILLVISCFLCGIFCYLYREKNFALPETFNSPLSVSYSWFACLTIIAIGKKFFNKNNKFTDFMRKKSYGIYVFHYLFISSSAYYLHKYTNFCPLNKYFIICFLGFFGSIVIFEIISRIPIIRWCVLGIVDKKNKNNAKKKEKDEENEGEELNKINTKSN